MPIEPLQTDEKIIGGAPRPKSMDDLMLFGCTGFVLASITSYLLSVWPHFLMPAIDQLPTLLSCLAIGFVPSALVGGFASRRYGLPGACGYIGGALATGVFLYLRMEATFIGYEAKQTPQPEYPEALMYLVPLAWILASGFIGVLLAAVHHRRSEESDS
jgi:hypothetical protein